MADFTIEETLEIANKNAALGNYQEAINLYRGILIHDADHYEASLQLANSLFETRQLYEALYRFWRIRQMPEHKHDPQSTMGHALCLGDLGHLDLSIAELERAEKYALNARAGNRLMGLIYNNIGNTLEKQNKHKDALTAFDKALHYDPLDPFPHYNRGISLTRLNKHRDAIAALTRAINLGETGDDKRRDDDAHYNRAVIRLKLGDLSAFGEYDFRLSTSENLRPLMGLPKDKHWNGGAIDGPLLVCAEQGLGDTIQFLRFIPALRARVPELILVVQTALMPLVKETWPDLRVLPGKTVVQDADYAAWMALMSAPARLGITREDQIPPPWEPHFDIERSVAWKEKLDQALSGSTRMRVGVCWAGNFQHKNDEFRSIRLEQFAKLFDVPVDFVSLQQMRPAETQEFGTLQERHDNLKAIYLTDFRDTAAVIYNLDLVICVDTAVAHMAATLGAKTWIMLPCYNTDWRWQLERVDCPWYPSARLIRQRDKGSWKAVLAQVGNDLVALSDQTRAAA